MNKFASSPAYLNRVLSTYQTTVYVAGDNGTFQTGSPHRYELLTTGQYSGTVNITINGKTDAHSNAVVIDHQTCLMWSRTQSASVGPASNGKLPFTTNANGEGIFPYAAAANAALLAGYGNNAEPLYNWRIPNIFELYTLSDQEAASGLPDTNYFSGFPADTSFTWSSTSRPNNSAVSGLVPLFLQGIANQTTKTDNQYVLLVRNI